jgi:hypothetical protein
MRYRAIEGSQSAHCCFEATVIDSSKLMNRFPDDDRFEVVCECFELGDAEKIAAALNAANPED